MSSWACPTEEENTQKNGRAKKKKEREGGRGGGEGWGRGGGGGGGKCWQGDMVILVCPGLLLLPFCNDLHFSCFGH